MLVLFHLGFYWLLEVMKFEFDVFKASSSVRRESVGAVLGQYDDAFKSHISCCVVLCCVFGLRLPLHFPIFGLT